MEFHLWGRTGCVGSAKTLQWRAAERRERGRAPVEGVQFKVFVSIARCHLAHQWCAAGSEENLVWQRWPQPGGMDAISGLAEGTSHCGCCCLWPGEMKCDRTHSTCLSP